MNCCTDMRPAACVDAPLEKPKYLDRSMLPASSANSYMVCTPWFTQGSSFLLIASSWACSACHGLNSNDGITCRRQWHCQTQHNSYSCPFHTNMELPAVCHFLRVWGVLRVFF
eukprot:GHRQ01023153.1.p1 GENE.GHRQ01023153.1~~GHRQ01023153.1.p1  ORF type:complete len:113 (-),score=12.96 GHRQ01023153.1:303-641(-)